MKDKMQIATINIPDEYLDAIEKLISIGLYNNRSEVVREALKEFIDREKDFTSELKGDLLLKLAELDKLRMKMKLK
ncbi:MAG: ribbon-helix-helix domain-containing protein [Promethearchaeota archaeon]